jgi:hypothetical protein
MMEEEPRRKAVESGETMQIGKSRPPLPLTDLPEPEEVFKIKGRIGPKQLFLYVLGPSMIALGVSIGSGEWLVGPRTVGGSSTGFIGIGWIVLVSAVLQVFYNVEVGRFTLATGEAPVVAFGRVPPGFWLWTPLAVFLFYLAFIWGGWAQAAGESLFPLIYGRARTAAEISTVKALGVGLLFLVFGITLFGRKISRTLEIVNWFMVVFILLSVVIIAILVVPAAVWGNSFASLVTPAAPPPGTSATNLGALAGFTAFASGLNFVLISYYRDKGYGMGSRIGYIAGLVGGKQEQVRASGVTFRDTPENAARWRRWFRYLIYDQWGIFFVGALRHDAPDDDRLPACPDVGTDADRAHDPNLCRGPAWNSLPEHGLLATVGVDRRIHDFVLHAAGRLRAPHPSVRGRRPCDQSSVPEAHRGRPPPLLLSVHARTDRPHFSRHLSGSRVPTDSGIRQFLKPPRDDHPVRGDLPQSAAAETGPAEVVVVCGLAPERGLLRVFLHQLRIERSPIPVLG